MQFGYVIPCVSKQNEYIPSKLRYERSRLKSIISTRYILNENICISIKI